VGGLDLNLSLSPSKRKGVMMSKKQDTVPAVGFPASSESARIAGEAVFIAPGVR
jgi:hypothetical protein